MSHLIVEDLSRVRTSIGQVLIKPGPENDHVVIGEENHQLKVWLDSSYDPLKFSVTFGEVVCVPPRIDDVLETTIEIEKGDTVFFHYLSCANAIRDKKYIIHNNQFYYIVNYSALFCAKRNDQVITLNGHILVEPIDDSLNDKTDWGFIIPENIRKKNHCNLGRVVYAGNPLLGQKKTCNEGDLVFFRTFSNTPLQYELFSNFKEKNTYYRMKYENIYGIKNEHQDRGLQSITV